MTAAPYPDQSRMEDLTLPQALAVQAGLLGDKTAIREKAYGIWQSYSWRQYYGFARNAGLGLMELGLKRGDQVGIITTNIPEWAFAQLGSQAAGAVTLCLFTTAVAEELATSLGRFQASYVFVQDQEQADKLLSVRGSLPHVKKVIYIDPTGMRSYRDDEWLISFRELLELGEKSSREAPDKFETELRKGRQKETALMILTSGTTGLPKLAMLTHSGVARMGRKWEESLSLRQGADWISITPPAWIVDQMWLGVSLMGGLNFNFPEKPETVLEDMREIGPQTMITSSRFWEDLASSIRVKISESGAFKRKIFRIAASIGARALECELAGKRAPLHLALAYKIAAAVSFRPLLDRVGCSRLTDVFTGGHPISPDVIRFLRSLGLNLKQCYGLTEAGGIFQIQPDSEIKMETVGKPLPGVNVSISGDQEILVSGDGCFSGYYMDYKSTEAAFAEGWLKTGDAGYLDSDGHLVVLGRKEEIIRNRDGFAFSPDFIETRLKFSNFIKEAVVFGEARPYLTAIINIDPGNTGNWAEGRMIPFTTYMDLTRRPEIEELIGSEIQNVNAQLQPAMKIRRFCLLYKLLDADDEELTRTGKVRRRFVYGLYLKIIEAMYGKDSEIDVKGKIRYQDGRVGTIETKVKLITLN
ncbi:MAG: AMP-binding protein [Syntrophaceae bacterium]